MDLTDKSLLEIYKMVLSGQLPRFPYGIWKGESVKHECKEVIRYFIEEVLRCSKEKIPQKVTYNAFKKYKLCGMLQHVFNHSPFEAIDFAYPGEFQRWQFGNFSKHNWNGTLAAEAMRNLIEDKLNLTYNEALDVLDDKTIKEHGLGYILDKFYNGDVKRAVLDAKVVSEKRVAL